MGDVRETTPMFHTVYAVTLQIGEKEAAVPCVTAL